MLLCSPTALEAPDFASACQVPIFMRRLMSLHTDKCNKYKGCGKNNKKTKRKPSPRTSLVSELVCSNHDTTFRTCVRTSSGCSRHCSTRYRVWKKVRSAMRKTKPRTVHNGGQVASKVRDITKNIENGLHTYMHKYTYRKACKHLKLTYSARCRQTFYHNYRVVVR